MSKWQLPTQKGTELWPSATRSPVRVVFEGLPENSDAVKQLKRVFSGQINQFYLGQAQQASLSSLPQWRGSFRTPELALRYQSNQGHETVFVAVNKKVLAALLKTPRKFDESVMLDGYLGIWNSNAIGDDDFDIYVNDQFVGRTLGDGVSKCHVFAFGASALHLSNRFRDRLSLASVPEKGLRNIYREIRPEDEDLFIAGLEYLDPGAGSSYQPAAVTTPTETIVVEVEDLLFSSAQENRVEMRNTRDNGLGNYGLIWVEFLSRSEYTIEPTTWFGTGQYPVRANTKMLLHPSLFQTYQMDFGDSGAFVFDLRLPSELV